MRPTATDPGAPPSAELVARARRWVAADPDPVTRAVVADALAVGDGAVLAELFDGWLRFGTSGLRARRGPGPRRMNELVARCVAAGLVGWLDGRGVAAPRVVVAHDARHGSAGFAAAMAEVVAGRGGTPLRLPEAVPTPVGVWAGRWSGADATVVCTASHNPPSDGGVKVYLGDGAQPVPPDDAALADAIAATDLAALPPVGEPPPPVDAGPLVDAYLDHVAGLVGPVGDGDLPLVHTALHGVGGELVARAFERAGRRPPVPVVAQARPDPDFPTVAVPNPEEPGALDLAVGRAAQVGAAAVLASDPDADRLGVAVPAPPWGVAGAHEVGDGWVRLTGDQVGWLLVDHLLARGDGPDRLVVTTVEASRLAARLAARAGVHHVEVPTGFKWIARAAMARPELAFVAGYEQALGYSVDDAVRDKDGISAALVLAEVLGRLGAQGATVWDALESLARRVGHHATAARWWRGRDGDGATLTAAVAALRADPPTAVGGRAVRAVVDLAEVTPGSPVDGLVVELDDGARAVVRPSGTEPKLKVYVEVVSDLSDRTGAFAAAERAGVAAADALADEMIRLVAPR